RFHVSDPSDWYRISQTQISKAGGRSILLKFRTLGGALQFAYPNQFWDLSKFSFRGKKSSQRWLCVKLQQLLPGVQIFEDFQHPKLEWNLPDGGQESLLESNKNINR